MDDAGETSQDEFEVLPLCEVFQSSIVAYVVHQSLHDCFGHFVLYQAQAVDRVGQFLLSPLLDIVHPAQNVA